MPKAFLLSILFLTNIASGQNYDKLIADGLSQYNSGEYQTALDNFQKAYLLDSTKVEAYYYSGVTIALICHQTGTMCNEAIILFNRAISINPNYRKISYNRGICFMRLEMFNEALQDFDKAIKLDNSDGDYYANRGLVKYRMGLKKDACFDFQTGLQLNSSLAFQLKDQYCK